MARYLLAHPRFVRTYCRGVAGEVLELVVWSDSDWAGCQASRWSMRGGILAIGGGIVKSWSNRQASIALSSGEAEFLCRRGKAAMEALGAKSFLRDLGWKALLALNIDAEAAREIASKQGVGKIRHLEVWLQDVVRIRIICLSKVWGKTNPADELTNPMNVRETSVLLKRVGNSEVARVPFGHECVRKVCVSGKGHRPAGAFNTPWLLDALVLVQHDGKKSLE